MDRIKIVGGAPLKGSITISGAKNAALPLMCASILTDEPLTLNNLPDLADIRTLASVLEHLGVHAERDTHTITLDGGGINTTTAPYDMVRKMRASILVLGPLVARFGRAKVSLPGGCAIGNRPIDLHLRGLQELGAKITLEEGYVLATTPKEGLIGTRLVIPTVSVGATENLLMAATLAKGTTIIENAAREPEIGDLARCLNKMGAKISGIDTEHLIIEGVSGLKGATHSVLPDRIEAGSYAIASAITGGDIILNAVNPTHQRALIDALEDCGVEIECGDTSMRVAAPNPLKSGLNLRTQPFPGFATDMQAQMMTLLSVCDGASVIVEAIFENRFMHVPELARMGANITVTGNTATIRGVPKLKGAQVMATDLRASVSLVLAGLRAEGETFISRVYHLDRGYEHLENKLRGVGAQIERVPE